MCRLTWSQVGCLLNFPTRGRDVSIQGAAVCHYHSGALFASILLSNLASTHVSPAGVGSFACSLLPCLSNCLITAKAAHSAGSRTSRGHDQGGSCDSDCSPFTCPSNLLTEAFTEDVAGTSLPLGYDASTATHMTPALVAIAGPSTEAGFSRRLAGGQSVCLQNLLQKKMM